MFHPKDLFNRTSSAMSFVKIHKSSPEIVTQHMHILLDSDGEEGEVQPSENPGISLHLPLSLCGPDVQ